MHTDPISDMLTRIRNGLMTKKDEVVLPYSKLKLQLAQILQKNGYLKKIEGVGPSQQRDKKSERKNYSHRQIRIELKYKDGSSVITNLKRISKPGRRVYVGKDELPYVLNNLGIAIISTPQGLMTNKEARKKGLGGEVICEVY